MRGYCGQEKTPQVGVVGVAMTVMGDVAVCIPCRRLVAVAACHFAAECDVIAMRLHRGRCGSGVARVGWRACVGRHVLM